MATAYQQAAPPSRRLFAVAPGGLATSDDDACSWSLAPDLAAVTVSDAFADPVAPARVAALAAFIDPGGVALTGLYVSSDAGQTFGAPTYVAPAGETLISVETAASKPERVYLTSYRTEAGVLRSHVRRSDDGGGTWTDVDVTETTGDGVVRIAAVDPADPQTVFFRVTGSATDAIGVSRDGGATMTLPLRGDAQLTALLRRANGEVLAAAQEVVDGALHRSTDGGASWTRTGVRLGIRALAERAGKVYVATDNVKDGFALAVSADGGATFQPLLRFADVRGARACGDVVKACAETCTRLAELGTFAAAACSAGAAGGAGGGGRGSGGSAGAPTSGGGCGCAAAAAPAQETAPLSPVVFLGLFVITAAIVKRRRRA
jgi:hypothetical protein